MLVYLFLSEVYKIGLSGEAVLSQQFLWLLLGLAVVMIGLMFLLAIKPTWKPIPRCIARV